MVRGGQGMDAFDAGTSKFLKMTMGLKHYFSISVWTVVGRCQFISGRIICGLIFCNINRSCFGFIAFGVHSVELPLEHRLEMIKTFHAGVMKD